MRFSLDYEQKVRIVEWFIPNGRCPTTFASLYYSILLFFLPNEKYSLQEVNTPNGSDEFTSVYVLLQLMAVGNQAGKTFVWDIGVDDPTKARYIFLVVNILCCVFFNV